MDPLAVCFAFCSVMGFLNCWRLYKDKAVVGVSLFPSVVYGATNLFEFFYFLVHERPWAAAFASLMFAGNFLWLAGVFWLRSASLLGRKTG